MIRMGEFYELPHCLFMRFSARYLLPKCVQSSSILSTKPFVIFFCLPSVADHRGYEHIKISAQFRVSFCKTNTDRIGSIYFLLGYHIVSLSCNIVYRSSILKQCICFAFLQCQTLIRKTCYISNITVRCIFQNQLFTCGSARNCYCIFGII